MFLARPCDAPRMPPLLTIAQIDELLTQHFPEFRKSVTITSLGDSNIQLRMPFRPSLARAGGTISGPALMLLADTAAYFLVLAHCGPVVGAATSSLDIHFLARPSLTDVHATATLLRLGKKLVVSRVELRSDSREDLVAHATVTYALPSST
jgi:uncharacterized protein (TIGR00369 family)